MDEARSLDSQVANCAAAHQQLLASLLDLSDEQCRLSSLLPNWTIGHVLTHLARNADSHTGLFLAARDKRIGDQYLSLEQRNGDIDRGADRSAEAIVADLRSSIYTLEAQWATADHVVWSGKGRGLGGNIIEMRSIVFMRWREVEFHHADLGLRFGYQDLSPSYVRLELEHQMLLWTSRRSMGMTQLPEIAKKLEPTKRLAWLMGRLEVDGLERPIPF